MAERLDCARCGSRDVTEKHINRCRRLLRRKVQP